MRQIALHIFVTKSLRSSAWPHQCTRPHHCALAQVPMHALARINAPNRVAVPMHTSASLCPCASRRACACQNQYAQSRGCTNARIRITVPFAQVPMHALARINAPNRVAVPMHTSASLCPCASRRACACQNQYAQSRGCTNARIRITVPFAQVPMHALARINAPNRVAAPMHASASLCPSRKSPCIRLLESMRPCVATPRQASASL